MNSVLDASALVAVLLAEPGAARALEAAGDGGAVTSINFAEVRDYVVRCIDEPDAAAAVDGFIDRRMAVLPCDRDLARRAAELRSAHYRRRGRTISLADCFAIAAAETQGVPLVTSDQDQATVARVVGVEVLAIPNSAGSVPHV